MTPVLTTAVRAVVTLMAIAATAGQVAYLDALWWHALGLADTVARDVSPSLVVLMAAHGAVSVVSALFSVALVLHEGPRRRASMSLGVAFGAWSYLMAYSGIVMLLRPDAGAPRAVFDAHFLLVEMVGLAGLVRFTAIFPRPLDALEIAPSPDLPSALRPFHQVSTWMRRPSAPWGVGAALLVGLWSVTVGRGQPIGDAGLSPLMDAVRLGAAALVVFNLTGAWRSAERGERAEFRWLLAALAMLLVALALMIGGNVLVSVAGFREPTFAWQPLLIDLGLVGFFAGLALSVLDGGRWDARAVVLRVTTLGAVGTAALFLAAGLEALLAGRILAAFSLRTGVGTALALATAVSTYRPSERLIERLLPEG